MSVEDAMKLIKNKRPVIHITEVQKEALKQLEIK